MKELQVASWLFCLAEFTKHFKYVVTHYGKTNLQQVGR